MIVVKEGLSKEAFLESIAPQYIYSYILNHKNSTRVNNMREYLKSKGINLDEALATISECYKVNLVGESYLLRITSSVNIKDYTVNQLKMLIDRGNLEVKGTNLFTDAENFLKSNFKELYMMAMKKGDNDGSKLL